VISKVFGGKTLYTCKIPVISAFITTEVAINVFSGPTPFEGSISSGSIKRLIQNISTGGIQNDFKIVVVFTEPSHTY
jgi:hypothetical protein